MKEITDAQLLAGVKRDQAQNDVRKTTDELLITATACLVEARQGSTPTPALLQESLEALVQVVGRQDARIAALEAARAPHGLPLEGTGPLPLERT